MKNILVIFKSESEIPERIIKNGSVCVHKYTSKDDFNKMTKTLDSELDTVLVDERLMESGSFSRTVLNVLLSTKKTILFHQNAEGKHLTHGSNQLLEDFLSNKQDGY